MIIIFRKCLCWNIYEYERMNKTCKSIFLSTQRTFKSLFVNMFHGPNVSSQMESYKQNSRLCRSITWFHSVVWIPFTLSLYILLPWWKSNYSTTSIVAKWGIPVLNFQMVQWRHSEDSWVIALVFSIHYAISLCNANKSCAHRTESTVHLFNFSSLIFARTF